MIEDGHRIAFADWLGCAAGGVREPAARAAASLGDGLLERVAAVGAAGHVLDFDDTFQPGVAHVSAVVAPAALVVAARHDLSVAEALSGYTFGFEAAAALARASHPALYERGWHSTAVCGVVGAATAAAYALGLGRERARTAVAHALLGASGLQAAFGSDAKALQVGAASAVGVRAAQLTEAGASVSVDAVPAGFDSAYGGTWAEPSRDAPEVRDNWLKAYPCCLGTHSAIAAAAELRNQGFEGGELTVVVDPVGRRAAHIDEATDGLQAKFSIAYLTAFTLLHGPPDVRSFDGVDEEALDRASTISVVADPSLAPFEARLESGRETVAHVPAVPGSPEAPLDAAAREAKLATLTSAPLHELAADPALPARDLLTGLGR